MHTTVYDILSLFPLIGNRFLFPHNTAAYVFEFFVFFRIIPTANILINLKENNKPSLNSCQRQKKPTKQKVNFN